MQASRSLLLVILLSLVLFFLTGHRFSLDDSSDQVRYGNKEETYKVRKGDTLESIAKKCCGSVQECETLMLINNMQNSHQLCEGMVILLPQKCSLKKRKKRLRYWG